jgi:hypothetical protein
MIGFSKWLEEKSVPYQMSTGSNINKHAATMDYIPSGKTSEFRSKDAHNSNFTLSSDPVINQLLTIMHQKIDVLMWDYGKDAVERAVDSAAQLVPFQKSNCDKLISYWQKFKTALYGLQEELQHPWWGSPRSGPPNPVIYDVTLMDLNSLETVFDEINKLINGCNNEEIKQLFLNFHQKYSIFMPHLRGIIEKFKQNTPQK